MLSDENLDNRQHYYLKEMGVTRFDLAHPERLAGYQASGIHLPEECVLLLVADDCPQGEDATLFIKVLASMKLKPQQARHLTPQQLSLVESHHLTWVWFAGCDNDDLATESLSQLNQLHSPHLSAIHGNTQNRRDLWQQICSYDK